MKTLRLGVACVIGIAVAACSSTNAPTAVTPGPANQHVSTLSGAMSPETTQTKLLYASNSNGNVVDIFSVPGYSMTGQITHGIKRPEGLATDKNGNLYVANLKGDTITVYAPGATRPSLTLSESDGPIDVAVASNGYVYAGDEGGGIDVYPPGATSPSTRLTNSVFSRVAGVGVDESNNVYAAGDIGKTTGVVIEFVNGSGSGTNLGLTGLVESTGVIIDENNNLVVSDFPQGRIFIYPLGHTSPSRKLKVPFPKRSAMNEAENEIYVPESHGRVGVYTYPDGKLVTRISIGGFAAGAALSPAPTR